MTISAAPAAAAASAAAYTTSTSTSSNRNLRYRKLSTTAVRAEQPHHSSSISSSTSSGNGDSSGLEELSRTASFGGTVTTHRHASETTGTDMTFSVYMPPQAAPGRPVPVLYWLSGLTCTEENFITKAGAQRYLAEHGLACVCPDTSPRGTNLPGEHEAYDFGSGAGFYISAKTPGYADHYQMHDYILYELPAVIEKEAAAAADDENGTLFIKPGSDARAIFGHSMGGLGALNLFFRNPGAYRSVSAFAPICNPMKCPWGIKGLTGYLGAEEENAEGGNIWAEWDPSELMRRTNLNELEAPVLVSQGGADQFLKEQLRPETLPVHDKVIVEMHHGYDHSYYFIASFVQQHIEHHAKYLKDA